MEYSSQNTKAQTMECDKRCCLIHTSHFILSSVLSTVVLVCTVKKKRLFDSIWLPLNTVESHCLLYISAVFRFSGTLIMSRENALLMIFFNGLETNMHEVTWLAEGVQRETSVRIAPRAKNIILQLCFILQCQLFG